MREDRRPEILEATCRAIAREGIHGTYIRHVAEEAGVSRALISYYFPTRDELLAAALEYAETRAIEEIGARTPEGNAVERLTQMLLLEIDDSPAVRDNWIIWSEMTEAALFEETFRAPLKLWAYQWNEVLAVIIEEGQAEGTIPASVDPEAASERLTALVDGLGPRWLRGETPKGRVQELLRQAIARELT